MTLIDLNADLGEATGAAVMTEREVLAHVTTTHVACGFHAGGPSGIRDTIAAAVAHGVALGAHPSYPDAEGFGRRPMTRTAREIADDVVYQVGALQALADVEGGRIISVKPHGALYHRLEIDEQCARTVAKALLRLDGTLRLVLGAGSKGLDAAQDAGIGVLAEAFCDRGYLADGRLVDRRAGGALVSDPTRAAEQAIGIVRDGVVRTDDGAEIPISADTLCVHGDTPAAAAVAAAVRSVLEAAHVTVRAPGGG
jgi:5-oxoprolinase (ATP-hydrolysing) subunit A